MSLGAKCLTPPLRSPKSLLLRLVLGMGVEFPHFCGDITQVGLYFCYTGRLEASHPPVMQLLAMSLPWVCHEFAVSLLLKLSFTRSQQRLGLFRCRLGRLWASVTPCYCTRAEVPFPRGGEPASRETLA